MDVGEESIETLYRRYGPLVLRRARGLLGDDGAARDAMQEVFVKAMQSGAFFREEATPTSWLYRITTNHCLNLLRDAGRREHLLRQNARAPADRQDTELRTAIIEVLRQLPREVCEVAVYAHLDRLGQEEIAALLGLSPRTVRNRLREFQARAQLALGLTPEVAT
jgi:RNA polymerase sigma-70 factor, ECF subfamily